MKKFACVIVFLLLIVADAAAETAEDLIRSVDLRGFESFSREYQAGFSLEEMRSRILEGDIPAWQQIVDIILDRMVEPLTELLPIGMQMLLPSILLAMCGTILQGNGKGVELLCRIMLCKGGLSLSSYVLKTAEKCLRVTASFSDAVVPVLTAALTAAGGNTGAALISPAAALAGNLIEGLFYRYGIPLCACTACVTLVSNLSERTDLNRLTRLMKRIFNWAAGLAVTLFTALILLRGSAASVSDTLALRTAKYAVDSVSGVIGSGVSDAWETYLTGLSIARSTVGFSGAILLLSVCLKPMLTMAAAMIGLSIAASAIELCGEKLAAGSLDQLSGVCQMLLTLCGGSMAVWIILMGAMLSIGRSFV